MSTHLATFENLTHILSYLTSVKFSNHHNNFIKMTFSFVDFSVILSAALGLVGVLWTLAIHRSRPGPLSPAGTITLMVFTVFMVLSYFVSHTYILRVLARV
ncbi:hypothetical protein VN97_g11767 [Penicillium thymicola]|uniref:Uncharacterized protein n=1 Tax=Penicillium thymicola TaxID=293382 RepID=A0AAI9T7J7_PENTH|nr:hypothetical protein VN97_g11767 [Penicillium thymicola]